MAMEAPISLKGTIPEHHRCIDCSVNTHPGMPTRSIAEQMINRGESVVMQITEECEVYIVRDSVWKQAGMEPLGGCLCIGCLEKRLGRRLKPKDFPKHEFNDSRFPCTDRLYDRRGR
jgi:hypothetical protein